MANPGGVVHVFAENRCTDTGDPICRRDGLAACDPKPKLWAPVVTFESAKSPMAVL